MPSQQSITDGSPTGLETPILMKSVPDLSPTQPSRRARQTPVSDSGGPNRVVTKEQILNASLTGFAECGYQEATLAGIARELGVTAPLLLYHFGAKETLWRNAVDMLFARLGNVVEAAVEDGESLDGRGALETLVRRLVYFFASNREFHRILVHEASVKGPRLDWMTETHLRPLFAEIEAVYQRGLDEGSLKPMPFAHALFMILGAASHFLDSKALVSKLYGSEEFGPEQLGDYADRVIEFCFGGLAASDAEWNSASPLLTAAG